MSLYSKYFGGQRPPSQVGPQTSLQLPPTLLQRQELLSKGPMQANRLSDEEQQRNAERDAWINEWGRNEYGYQWDSFQSPNKRQMMEKAAMAYQDFLGSGSPSQPQGDYGRIGRLAWSKMTPAQQREHQMMMYKQQQQMAKKQQREFPGLPQYGGMPSPGAIGGGYKFVSGGGAITGNRPSVKAKAPSLLSKYQPRSVGVPNFAY